jgi:hypothetical protein
VARYLNTKNLERIVIDKIRSHVLISENLTRLAKFVSQELNSNPESYKKEIDIIEKKINTGGR